jgi:hypothetical protein
LAGSVRLSPGRRRRSRVAAVLRMLVPPPIPRAPLGRRGSVVGQRPHCGRSPPAGTPRRGVAGLLGCVCCSCLVYGKFKSLLPVLFFEARCLVISHSLKMPGNGLEDQRNEIRFFRPSADVHKADFGVEPARAYRKFGDWTEWRRCNSRTE